MSVELSGEITAIATAVLAMFAIVTAVYVVLAFLKQSQEIIDKAEQLKVQSDRFDLEKKQLEVQRKLNAERVKVFEFQVDAKYADSLSRPLYFFAETRSARPRHLNAGGNNVRSTRGTVRSRHGMTGRPYANYGNLCRVFEWHGWATIVASPSAEDDAAAEARQRAAEARVARVIAGAAGVANETLDVRSANGSVHIWLAGSHNHRDGAVTDLFRSIAKAAPGSYGVMYVLDDDVSYTWERLVMRRGTVSREVDTSLSPHIGVVEDPA